LHKSVITYPVAYNFSVKEIVPITNVTEDNKTHLFCPECKGRFIAVLRHQTPHFKHKSHIKCSGNPETYLHWLAKEVIKDVNEIEVPELLIEGLPEKHRQNFQSMFNKIVDLNMPESFRSIFKEGLKKNLSESRKILIDKYDIEQAFKTNIGDIVVDIVANTKSKILFIEPFFSNPVNKEKEKKLSLIKTPTLSIDLKKFIDSYGQHYSIQSLKNYLISKKGKKWVYLSNAKYNKHIKNYEKYLHEEINRNKDLIHSHNSKLIEIDKLEVKCEERHNKIQSLKGEIADLKKEIFDLKKELGINYL